VAKAPATRATSKTVCLVLMFKLFFDLIIIDKGEQSIYTKALLLLKVTYLVRKPLSNSAYSFVYFLYFSTGQCFINHSR
jgi:hypothetical protein